MEVVSTGGSARRGGNQLNGGDRGKRKKSKELQELDGNVLSEKQSKFEGKVVEMGQLMAKHMGSTEAVEMEEVKDRVKRSQGLVVPSVGRSGRLPLLWKPSLVVEVQSFSKSHIDAIIKPGGVVEEWRFTGFYGNPETSKRVESWQLLKRLSRGNSLLWVCVGDFNELMHSGEKEGGSQRPLGQMKNFCEAINTCQFRDLGYIGQDFTWSKKLGSRGWIRERLDRAFVSVGWSRRFPGFQLHHKANSSSDHCILLLKEVPSRKPKRQVRKSFISKKCGLRRNLVPV
nr:hypothetical protein CFP56_32095 [Quercus suber]